MSAEAQTYHFDYAIIGAGAAGLQLAYAIANDSWFDDKTIALIDRTSKNSNDKTWCFWEEGTSPWDEIIHHSWQKAVFHGPKKSHVLELNPYSYKMVRSEDFYAFVFNQLTCKPNFTLILDQEIQTVVNQQNLVYIKGADQQWSCQHCFDSRITPDFEKNRGNDRYIRIAQHFKGMFLRFKNPIFDPGQFTMMDFRMPFEGKTAFMYILPVSEKEALLEYTFFSKKIYDESVYDQHIHSYIQQYLSSGGSFELLETEQGIIPMTDFPFHSYSSERITKIGTAGSWVRPSTGYSFRKAGDYTSILISNLKKQRPPGKNVLKRKYYIYDALLLDILARNNSKGPRLFERMYFKNPITRIFRFLDGETSFGTDLKIMATFNPLPFMHSIWRRFILKINQRS